ncbi:GNAT family N-acetyltransferase [Clostridium chauvoei]|uniref:GNAT family N-acetyltransferase n=2 Tax=Clostridium chauvoei TaxID=46867 RepID=A0ABD4RF15_9CLOT|nr:GNAT family N-acetyltransferase [Clostridium chauvoei]ATD54335.1 GNAT family N-acetyltransferase [Clostridium chauvoei]ATD57981.1 GNAT family N-acetyltransferase [Clostridium chauvoei]MBX7279777.1 GNAT family N-acetyltransferase [Clostridium chauvoei]MBX7282146.1 GNAT family N-acetyltransferase [Clostridium chauvoei]MBX7284668.1 GNAT family N-acetyltransferase [Clostridium chauvoei]
MKLTNFTESHAKEICNWKYEEEYHVYNYPEWNKVCQENWAITLKEKREKEFIALIDESNNLCAYIRFQDKNDYILIGLGLKPSLCGAGLGKKLMNIVKSQSNKLYPNKKIILEVRSFNKRAIKCYERAGFKIKTIYNKNTITGYDEFVKMEFIKEIKG